MEQTTPTPQHFALVVPLAGGGKDPSGAFTYSSEVALTPGQLVMVPLGRRRSLGVVTATVPPPDFPTKPIERLLELPPLGPEIRRLAEWLGQYYATSPAAVWGTILPASLERRPRLATAPRTPTKATPLPPLTVEQTTATRAIASDERRTHLLQGVTGSGKTRVYLELAAATIAKGRSVIVLTPEIMLTPQLVGTFTDHFGALVIATHSRLTTAQRRAVWLEAHHSSEPLIVIGPRSSLFVPVPRLGLIIIDECHETSYKQEQAPRYHALRAAAKLAELSDAKLVLGSATPGLTEVFLAEAGRIGYHRLTHRIKGRPAPTSEIVDLRDKTQLQRSHYLSAPLLTALEETLAAGQQSLLFINRRGSASSQLCTSCGETVLCPNCQLPLTFHADLMRLICHHCNYRISPAAVCPNCGATELQFLGGGTKRIESEVTRLFPAARLARIDRDSATITHLSATYAALKDRTVDILIGTQMVAKGLDLPHIDLIGVVSADTMLQLPDYSAAERTFDTLLQVAGRAGRGDRPGRVIIQSYAPEHPAIRFAAAGDFNAFAAAELVQRQQLGYPPFRYLLKLTISAAKRETSQTKGAALATQLSRLPHVTILGPAPTLLETISGRYHWMVAVKSPDRGALVEIARTLPTGWTADLDPLNLL